MFKFIKGLFNKKEIARIKELELENEALRKENESLDKQLLSITDHALDLHLQLNETDYEEEFEDSGEKCNCGGDILPMYDEHPNWIKFCNRCDSRSEEDDYSPIVEPA